MAAIQNLDQRRASHAWKLIQQVEIEDEKAKKQFKLQAKRLPARIMAAGLGQALAFLEAKGYAPLLRAALADWMREMAPRGAARGGDTLLLWVVQGDCDFLRFATAECLAYLQWVVRFAEAQLRDVDVDDEEV